MARKRPPHAARKQPRARTPTPPNGNAAPRKPPLPTASPAPGMFPGTAMASVTLAGAALCLLVAVSYFPALAGGFVWDDAAFTTAAPVQSVAGLWQIWFEPHAIVNEGHYWPLLYTTFWLEHRLWGFAPFGSHLVNLLLHGLVTLLLWRLLRRLEVPGAWFAAAVFAVHPVHVEPVAWVIGRKDMLAALFSLACVLAYLRFAADGGRRSYIQALVFLVAGLLCKSIVVTLPLALLLWHWWQQGRVTPAAVRTVAPLLLLAAGITLADWGYYKGREVIALEAYSWVEHGLLAARVLWFYVGKLLWPTELAVIYPHWEVSVADPLAWAGGMAAGAVAALLWWYRGRIGRGPLAGVLFFVLTLSPTLGFVSYGYMQFSFVADRYQYLAMAGITVPLVAGAARVLGPLPTAARTVAQVMALLLLAVMGAITWNQAGIYRDNVTFYRHIISLNPQARNAYYNLGREYHRQGHTEEALAAYRTARTQRPDDIWVNTGLGIVSLKLGRLEQAQAYLQRALQMAPQSSTILNPMGALRLRQRRYREALDIFETLIEMEPGFAKFYSGRGAALDGLNRAEDALRSFDRALELDPSMEEARINRDLMLKKLQGRGT